MTRDPVEGPEFLWPGPTRCSDCSSAPSTTSQGSLDGYVSDHDRFILDLHLRTLERLNEQNNRVGERVEEVMPDRFREAERSSRRCGAETLLVEISVNMSVFRTSAHLISRVGLCGRVDSTTGKRRSARVRMGTPWLKPPLVQPAWAVVRKKDSYLMAFLQHVKSRRGPKRASVAVAAKLQTTTGRVSHSPQRDCLPRPRRRLPCQPRPRSHDATPRQTTLEARLRRRTPPPAAA